MRQSQLRLLGLILALFLGVRVGNPGPPANASASPAPTIQSEKRSSPRKVTKRAGGSAQKSAASGDCNAFSASAKEEWLQLSPSPRGPRPCVSALSPLLKEICKLNPSYPSDKLPSNEELANLSDADAVKRCLGSDRPTIFPVMASVANPLRTHLGLMTDRTIEAIQVAAAEANFLPQSHYLPWPAPSSNSDSEAQPASPDETDSPDPGILIFRNNDDKRHSPQYDDKRPRPQYLVVFLIPELPTEGLDRKVFAVAESIIEQISSRDGSQLFFAGPTFSGSLVSLEAIKSSLPPNKCILAFSGSVANPPSNLIQEPGCPKITRTRSTNCEALGAFVTGAGTFGYRPEQIAILSEAGTQYGTPQLECLPVGPSGGGPLLFLNFPREISKLRNAYGAETSSAAQAASANPQTDLQMSWQDSQAARGDDVQAYGRGQTPLSQETVLSTLSITLKARGIKALGIIATDPMDEAFLIHSIKQSSPDVRLFLPDPDLLYLRTPDVASLNGTLLVSYNPLIPQNQFWSSPRDADRNRLITFPSGIEESQYNAFVLLLEKADLAPPPTKDKAKMKLLERGWPAGKSVGKSADSEGSQTGAEEPPLWLATIGTATNYPVKILNSTEGIESKLGLHSLDLGKLQYAPLVLWFSLAALGILHASLLKFKEAVPSSRLKFKEAVPSVFKQDFDLTDKSSTVTLVKIFCHLMAVLTTALAQMILGSSFLFFYDSSGRYKSLACGVVLVTVFLLGAVGWQVFMLHKLQRQQKQLAAPDEGAKIVDVAAIFRHTLVIVSMIIVPGMFWLGTTMKSHFDNAFLHFRDLNLTSGVAVALPIASLLMVMYFGIWAYLRRLAYWEHRYVEMFDLKLDKVIRKNLNVDVTAIDKCLLGPLENRAWMIGFGLTSLLSVFTFRPWVTLDILEPIGVWWFLFCFLVLAVSVLWLNWFRFVNIWVHLRNILEHLENLPLRTAFERLPREKSLPILQWGEARNTFLLRQVLDRLRALASLDTSAENGRLLTEFEAKMDALMKCGVVETEIVEHKNVVGGAPRTILRTFSRSRQDLLRGAQGEMTDVIDALSTRLLKEYWRRGSSGTKEGQEPRPVDRKFILAEDIVALPFYAYIRRVLNELRNILFFLGIAVSLLFAALHTYAFRADQAINWWFFGLFVVMGGGVVFIIGQMERNAVLSRLSNTNPGELGTNFYVQLVKYGAIPALTIFGSQVPQISNLLLKWVQPALQALH